MAKLRIGVGPRLMALTIIGVLSAAVACGRSPRDNEADAPAGVSSHGSPVTGEGVAFLDAGEARYITEDYAGRILTYAVAEDFGFRLDDARFPLHELSYKGCPIQVWKSRFANGPTKYPIEFSASSPGTCEVQNGTFRVNLRVVAGVTENE